MRYMSVALLLIFLLAGCAAKRPAGEPYPGYSCRESLSHFYAHCSKEKLTKDDFESKVQSCEKELATKVCDKEQVDILWCQGRVQPGQYYRGYFFGRGYYAGENATIDGCDCSVERRELKKCRMQKGLFD